MTTTVVPPHERPTAAPIPRATVSALIGKAVKDRTQVVGAASFYMLAIGAVLGVLWPPLRDVFRNLPQSMVDLVKAISGGTDLSTPAGWANAELLSLVAPAAVIVVAIMSAAASSAGEEEKKTLGLTLSAPVNRSTFLVATMVAMAISVLIVSICIGLGLVLGNVIGNLGLSLAGIIGVAAHAFVFGLLFGALAFLLGAATGSKRVATLGSTLAAVLAFAANTFLPLDSNLAAGQKFSPWYYYNSSNPLTHGAQGGYILLLVAISILLAVAAVLVFRRRDLRG
ncbi:ABC transporter permease subunit [Diaminobutyricibacter sp. McL0608]|uniref:ABC transporter permease subunit n=1 Tax=Leifsonia sp. McL0608 TaxID=3143537 RepID=UPI0031F3253F